MSVGVVVLGMHRSGTSAVAQVLVAAGARLPHAAGVGRTSNPANERGFAEVPALSRVNERILRALDGEWSAPPTLADGWLTDPRVQALRPAAGRAARRHLRGSGLVWKDPRLCLTLRFWHGVITETTPVVLAVRNPLEVAASLATRDGLSLETGLALWERYMCGGLTEANGRATLVVCFEDLVTLPVDAARAAATWLRTTGVQSASPADSDAAPVRPELRHATFPDADVERDPRVTESQRSLFLVATRLAGAHERLVVPVLPAPSATSIALLEHRRRERAGARAHAAVPHRRARRAVRSWTSEVSRRARSALSGR